MADFMMPSEKKRVRTVTQTAPKSTFQMPSERGAAPVMTRFSKTGPTFVSPSAEADVAAAKATAAASAKAEVGKKFKEKAYNDFYNEVTMLGKPVADIKYGELLKAVNGNLDMANQFIKTRNAFMGTKSDLQNTQKAVVGMLNTFVKAAKRIPSSSGFVGKRLQGPMNSAMEGFGQLPQREAYNNVLNISGPLLRRAMGDVGNAGEKETKMALDALKGLVHPQSEVRQESVSLLNSLFTDLIGKRVELGGSGSQDNGISAMSDEELMKQLGE